MAKRRTTRIADVLGKRRWSNSDAQVLIAALHKSGKSSADFAREHKIKPERIWRWTTRLRDQPGLGSEAVHFHPVQLVGSIPNRESAAVLEVVLVDGRSVRLGAGFAAIDLARVLSVLEGKVSC
jgi:transposase-like protein